MANEFNNDYQYDSCISRGICSINPRNSALQTVIVLYLKLLAKILLKNSDNDKLKSLLLNTAASSIFNQEFNDETFLYIIKNIKAELSELFDKNNEILSNDYLNIKDKDIFENINKMQQINYAIKYGENIFKEAQENINQEVRNLYSIMLIIIKSLSINLLRLKNYNYFFEDGFIIILKTFEKINLINNDTEILKTRIITASKINIEALKILREKQEEAYGIQQSSDVSYSTSPGKAILVAGADIEELKILLEKIKDLDIDVYTHDEMLMAHTFPEIKKYQNLKGQYGQGLENCLLDFATFPGPILFTKHSLRNVENLYRGMIYTTDIAILKGIIKIKNEDFSELIENAKKSRGFKTGKICESINIGYNYNDIIEQIKNKIATNHYKKIILIGIDTFSSERKIYFEKLINYIPNDVLIISFYYNIHKENLIFINTCFDSYSLIKIYNHIKELNIPIATFIPKCDKDSISQIIYLNSQNVQVYFGECSPIMLNPSLLNTLENLFLIKKISIVKNDLKNIL